MGYSDPEKRREYARKWMAKRRKDWFDANGPCVDCGSWESLELDHVDPSLKVDHKVWSWTESRRLAELSKCEPRCEGCHKKKTRQWIIDNVTHCVSGHEFSERNTRWQQTRWGIRRQCRECDRLSKTRKRNKLKRG